LAFETVAYSADDKIARIVLNRPERLNAINAQLISDFRDAVAAANDDPSVRVIVLSGAGQAFCAGYDLDWATRAEDATQRAMSGQWDPGRDYQMMSHNVRTFMSLWESPKPVIAQIHGWCVGGGTDMALCSDLIYAAEDAQIGYPPARVWGEPTTVMWVYRLGLEHAKRLMLSGEALSGTDAERLGLASKAVPTEDLSGVVDEMARKLATIPSNQLAMSKLLVNQAYENMGLRTSQLIGTVMDGLTRHTPEGIAWRDMAMKEGFREAVRRRDAPFGDYGERKKKDQASDV
jgi:enoyl-CoA hydratase